ncbi:MAG: hypothetical protein ACFNNL_01795 [Kingella oralis]
MTNQRLICLSLAAVSLGLLMLAADMYRDDAAVRDRMDYLIAEAYRRSHRLQSDSLADALRRKRSSVPDTSSECAFYAPKLPGRGDCYFTPLPNNGYALTVIGRHYGAVYDSETGRIRTGNAYTAAWGD